MSYRFNAPPGWPPPPIGWVPPPGWRPDPGWPPAPIGWQFWIYTGQAPVMVLNDPARTGRRPGTWPSALDEEVRSCDALAGAAWRARVGWLPVVVLIGVVLATQALGRALLDSVSSASLTARVSIFLLLSLTSYGVILLACYRIAAPVAVRCGGMSRSLGWRRPTPGDLGTGIAWSVASFVVRLIAVIVVVIAIPALRGADSSNVSVPHHASVMVIAALGLVAVVLAPPVEELVFRGLVLRTAMRRMPFWPAALLSSVLFGLLHTYEVNTLAGATILGVSITVFGLTQCVLVRWKARLGPAIVSHAASNAFVLALAVLTSR